MGTVRRLGHPSPFQGHTEFGYWVYGPSLMSHNQLSLILYTYQCY